MNISLYSGKNHDSWKTKAGPFETSQGLSLPVNNFQGSKAGLNMCTPLNSLLVVFQMDGYLED